MEDTYLEKEHEVGVLEWDLGGWVALGSCETSLESHQLVVCGSCGSSRVESFSHGLYGTLDLSLSVLL
jgi:hypothetical protein